MGLFPLGVFSRAVAFKAGSLAAYGGVKGVPGYARRTLAGYGEQKTQDGNYEQKEYGRVFDFRGSFPFRACLYRAYPCYPNISEMLFKTSRRVPA
jgi:hypothetical protein